MKPFVDAPRFQLLLRRAPGAARRRRGRPRALEARRRRARLPAGGLRVPGRAEARRGERRRVAPAARGGPRRGRPLPLPRGPLPRGRHLRPGHAAARARPRPRGRRGAAAGLRPAGQGHAAPHRAPRAPGASRRRSRHESPARPSHWPASLPAVLWPARSARPRPGPGGAAQGARPDPAEGLQARLDPQGPGHDGARRPATPRSTCTPTPGRRRPRTWTAG